MKRRSSCLTRRRALAVAILTILALFACGSKSSGPEPLGKLTKADGPVDREDAAKPKVWGSAAVGTGFFLGDAARTADGGAQIELAGASATIAMQPRTVLRFGLGGTNGGSKLAVETGAIDLSGQGTFSLNIGDVKLAKNSAVRITANGSGASTLELTLGDASVTSSSGQTLDLALGKTFDLALDLPGTGDAGVADAPAIDAPIDAPPITSTDSTIIVTGKKAEILDPGTTTWKPLAEGTAAVTKGSKIRLGNATTAKLTSGGAALALGAGSRVEITQPDGAISLEAGGGTANVEQGLTGKIVLPGGSVAISGTKDSSGSARIDLGKETKVSVLRGTAKLAGANGAELAMSRGESATLTKAGLLHPLEAIPSYFDFTVAVGETLTIHDPRGATAVQFSFAGKCTQGIVEVDHDARFHTARVSSGKDAANLMLQAGGWAYRLRCSTASGDGAAVASGRIAVTRDDGRRALPKQQSTNDIDADGRNYTVSYQSTIPNLRVLYKGPPGTSFKLHFATGGKEETFDGGAKITVPGNKLKEGTYTYWFDRDGTKDAKVSQLKIDFDQTAPQVYIESPVNGKPWVGDVDVRGAVLTGWTAAVDSITIPIDAQRRFAAKISPPSTGQALAIKLSHPQRGVHYYLRRQK